MHSAVGGDTSIKTIVLICTIVSKVRCSYAICTSLESTASAASAKHRSLAELSKKNKNSGKSEQAGRAGRDER